MNDRERLEEEINAAYLDVEELDWIVRQYELDSDFTSEGSYEDTLHELTQAENHLRYLERCLEDE